MVSKDKFWEVGGFDPTYRVTFNDVDLCLKFREAGYANIYLPFVRLTHHESISVGRTMESRDMTELYESAKLMRNRWAGIVDNDPYYNKNFYILSSHFDLDVYPDGAVE
jgi:GT2 family glycosyltransferase